MRARLVVAIVGLLASSLTARRAGAARTAADDRLRRPRASGDLKLICNQQAPEDLVVVPGGAVGRGLGLQRIAAST